MNNKPNYAKGNRREIIYLLLNLGILPYPAIRILSKSEGALNRTHQTIVRMEKEGVIERKKLQKTRYGSQFLTLKNYEKNKPTLTEYIPRKCVDYYQDNHRRTIYTTWTDSNATGMRKINEAYLGAMMYGSGYDTFPDQSHGEHKFYNSKELKRYLHYGDDVPILDGQRKVAFTKGYGVAVSKGGNYMSYMTWHNTLPNVTEGEHKFVNMAYSVVLKLDINHKPMEGLIFLNNLRNMSNYIGNNVTKSNHNRLLNMLSIYPSVYVLPYTIEGRKHLEIMSEPLWQEKLIKEATGELQDTKSINYSCHHYDRATGIGTLVFCIPDIGMLQNFYITASTVNNRSKFRIICFDYQKDFIKNICGNICDIYTTPIDEYYENIGG